MFNKRQELIVNVFDYDKVDKDDFIGKCVVPLADIVQ